MGFILFYEICEKEILSLKFQRLRIKMLECLDDNILFLLLFVKTLTRNSDITLQQHIRDLFHVY